MCRTRNQQSNAIHWPSAKQFPNRGNDVNQHGDSATNSGHKHPYLWRTTTTTVPPQWMGEITDGLPTICQRIHQTNRTMDTKNAMSGQLSHNGQSARDQMDKRRIGKIPNMPNVPPGVQCCMHCNNSGQHNRRLGYERSPARQQKISLAMATTGEATRQLLD